MKITLAGKFALGIVVLILIVMATATTIFTMHQKDQMEEAMEERGELLAATLSIAVQKARLTGDLSDIGRMASEIMERNSDLALIRIEDERGRELAEVDREVGYTTRTVTSVMGRPERPLGRVVAEFSMARLDSEVKKMRMNALYLTGIILAAAVLVSAFLTKSMTRPIERISLAAEKVAEGDLTQRVSCGSRDEIGSLADNFNRMVTSLEESREALQRSIDELSTLHEIGRIINMTDDREEIMNLIIETIGTGFEMERAAIFLLEGDAWTVGGTTGSGDAGGIVEDPPAVLIGAEAREGPWRPEDPSGLRAWGLDGTGYAVPLRSGGVFVGVMIAEGRGIERQGIENILSVIGSQIAQPVRISQLAEKAGGDDIILPVLGRIEGEISKVAEFGLPLTVMRLKLSEASTDPEREVRSGMKVFAAKVEETAWTARTEPQGFLAILPGLGLDDARRTAMRLTADEILGAFIAVPAEYPSSGSTALDLLSRLYD